eukprot:gnl/Dysnectes_brevis/2985_a3677_946.p1 GENE.gnl/Dysnectes_brevis/2985_a3677_946~~gnl/Dysnectes_brevis/2985_a3677_946.p1  ORF type:complete len:674 (-),score=151.14 gnl/Dysnectes_brevis/2985_a3677_946:35-2029(-)
MSEDSDAPRTRDYSSLVLKPNHVEAPAYVLENCHVLLETFSKQYHDAYDFLITISEPLSRPELVHEYEITKDSLSTAVSVGLDSTTIIASLNRFSKNVLPHTVSSFIEDTTRQSGRVTIQLKDKQYYLSTKETHRLPPSVLPFLTRSSIKFEEGFEVDLHHYALPSEQVSQIRRAIREARDPIPIFEEYQLGDKLDKTRALQARLKPTTTPRDYQRKALGKLLANNKCLSGIIVLPCGAGKTLVGISAACKIDKCCIVLCTSKLAGLQWRNQFCLFTTVRKDSIFLFDSSSPHAFDPQQHTIVISTYQMMTHHKPSGRNKATLDLIRSQEWGLIIFDEVHNAFADIRAKIFTSDEEENKHFINAHVKLGLTATLVREDSKLVQSAHLIGPKLYEANWLDLARKGYIANVQCSEVRCPMPAAFFREYMSILRDQRHVAKDAKQMHHKAAWLSALNPEKIRTCERLVRYHRERGDKILIFSDSTLAAEEYARLMRVPFIHGENPESERVFILNAFLQGSKVNTIVLSRVGDNSLDLPDANVLIEVSWQEGSRRQETQRMGRISRPNSGSAGRPSYYPNAFFYVLVSTDTREEETAQRRRRYLLDQGYAYASLRHSSIRESCEQLRTPCELLRTPAEEEEFLQSILEKERNRRAVKEKKEKKSKGLK